MQLFHLCLFIGIAVVSGESSTDSPSSLSHILDILGEGSNMHNVLKLVKELKQGESSAKKMISFSPLAAQLMNDLANKSPKIKLAYDIMEGHIPTLKDLYELLVSGHVNNVLKTVLAENKLFQELSSLMNDPNFEHSTSDIQRSIAIVTGHKLDISSAMVRDPKSGITTLTTSTDNKYRNLIELFLGCHENWNSVLTLVNVVYEDNSQTDKIVEATLKIDPSRLYQITRLPSDGGKYSVAGGLKGADPEVMEIQQLLKSMKTDLDNSNFSHAVSLNSDVSFKVFDIYNRCMEQALMADANTGTIG